MIRILITRDNKEHLRVTAGVRMKQLASIFFHVNPCDSKLPVPTTKLHWKIQINATLLGNGNVKLRNLVPLGQVRVEVLLPIKLGSHGDLTVKSKAQPHGTLDNLLIQNWQRPRVSHAGRADSAVRLGAIVIWAGAKCLGDSRQLDMGLNSDDRFETLCLLLCGLLGRHLNRLGCCFWLSSLGTLRPTRETCQWRTM
jgi:hypothetical protein